MVVSGGFRKQRRKEVKGKGERKRYTQLNTEFQRIAREDKKGFLNEQCKEIEENNRKGKTRDLFEKIGDTKGTFHVRTGMIKDRNSKDLREAEEIKKVGRIHRTIQKRVNYLDSHDGVITHLELDIPECGVKRALGSNTTNKASGGDRVSVELFQILKDDAVKVLHSICQQIWKTHQWPQDCKRSSP